jgi:hypothetical protein
LRVTFNDGVSGVFPVEPERRGGVFLKLLDSRVFNAVTVNPDFGCVEWLGGADLCPDAMRQAMTGSESEAEFHSAEGAPGKADSLYQTGGAGWAAAPGNYPELEMDRAAVAEGQLHRRL